MRTIDERSVDPIDEMTRIARSILSLPARGFKEAYRSVKPGELIFDSAWCRISLVWEGWDYGSGNTMLISYGRLHAPNESTTMIWQGEECNCWHRIEQALHFLDRRTPTEAAELYYSHSIMAPFYEENQRQQYKSQPEWLANMHVAIWQNYGPRLFELFDLQRPELWQQYRLFLKEVYDIVGRFPGIEPPLDKVC